MHFAHVAITCLPHAENCWRHLVHCLPKQRWFRATDFDPRRLPCFPKHLPCVPKPPCNTPVV